MPYDRRVTRRRGILVLLVVGGALTVACNAITGQRDRVLDEREADADTIVVDDAGLDVGPDVVDAAPDTKVDPVTINVPASWSTPNGAIFTTDGGTQITGFTTYSHPVLVATPAPVVPSQDYTVEAVVLAPTKYEFGILVRIQPDGTAGSYGSLFVGNTPGFLGIIGPPTWSPSKGGGGASYVFTPGARYKIKIRVVGPQITVKQWLANQPEPALYQGTEILPWSTGTGVGFYTYHTSAVGVPVLESMKITVP